MSIKIMSEKRIRKSLESGVSKMRDGCSFCSSSASVYNGVMHRVSVYYRALIFPPDG